MYLIKWTLETFETLKWNFSDKGFKQGFLYFKILVQNVIFYRDIFPEIFRYEGLDMDVYKLVILMIVPFNQ